MWFGDVPGRLVKKFLVNAKTMMAPMDFEPGDLPCCICAYPSKCWMQIHGAEQWFVYQCALCKRHGVLARGLIDCFFMSHSAEGFSDISAFEHMKRATESPTHCIPWSVGVIAAYYIYDQNAQGWIMSGRPLS